MSDRRSFVKKLLGSTLGAWWIASDVVKGTPRAALPSPAAFPEEEDYWDVVRSMFPMAYNYSFLNSATRGPSPYPVLDAFEEIEREFSSTGRYVGISKMRVQLAALLGIDAEELAITRNTTEGINIIASGLEFEKKDEVIITTREHVGNALPWLLQMEQRDIKLVPFEPADTTAETLQRIESLITKRTRVIAVPHITSPTGTVLPVKEIARLAKKNKILSFIDGAQALGQVHLDFKEIGCDFYASCFHKWALGPAGVGFLYIRKKRLKLVTPRHVGAYSDKGWEISKQKTKLWGFVDSARMFEYGTHSAALVNGSLAAMEFLKEIGTEKIEARVRQLATTLRIKLLRFSDDITILTPLQPTSYAGTIGFRMEDIENEPFFEFCMKRRIRVRYVPESGLNSIRISLHIFNNEKDIDRLIQAIEDFLATQ